MTTGIPQSILVPVDFSAVSNEALLFAMQLARCSSLPLLILHIVHHDACRPERYPRRSRKEQILPIDEIAGKILQAFMTDMREQHPDSAELATARVMAVNGLPATRIAEIARRTGASRIVMGSSGRSRLSRLLAGSVSDSVIRKSHVPVTLVHSNGTIRDHGKIDARQAGGVEPYQVSTEPG